MSSNTIINPLKNEVESLQSFKDLMLLNEARIKKVMGTDADWLIQTEITDPSKPDKLPDSQVYQSLQNENDWLWETVELLNKGWYQNKLWLDSVEDEAEASEAIINLLKDVRLYWRTYLESNDKEIFKKMPVLGSRFSKHENRIKAFDLITTMGEVLEKVKPIEDLLTEWHGGKAWDNYNKKYDFDNSLWAFTQLLYLKKKYQAEKEQASQQEKSLVENLSEKVRDLELELKGEKQMSEAEISNLQKKIEALKLVIRQSQEEKPTERSIEEITRNIPGAYPNK